MGIEHLSNKVVNIFEEDFTAVVQPGVDREALNAEVRQVDNGVGDIGDDGGDGDEGCDGVGGFRTTSQLVVNWKDLKVQVRLVRNDDDDDEEGGVADGDGGDPDHHDRHVLPHHIPDQGFGPLVSSRPRS